MPNWERCEVMAAMRLARVALVGTLLAIAAVFAFGCGDPTAELLEGMAARVTSGEETPLEFEAELCVNAARIRVVVADTQEERAAGLSGYAGLPEDAGMLFVFAEPTQPSFWMKGMRFSIDIIWISYVTVVQIDASAPPPSQDTPDDQLPRYRPTQPITHVLELPAGAAERYGITVGSRITPCADATPTPERNDG